MNPKEELLNGVKVLEPILQPCGFKFVLETQGLSSGGYSAGGAFVAGDKRLELHFRYSLGWVSYQIGAHKVNHADYITAQGGKGRYPGFSKKPIDAFRNMADDLRKYGALFLKNETTQFEELAKELKANPPIKGFKALSSKKR